MTGIRDSLRIGLLIGLGTSFAVVIGMLQVFAERFVIAEVLTLSTLMLVGIFLAAGLYAVRKLQTRDLATLGVNGAVAGATVVVIVVAAVLAATGINNFVEDLDMSSVFPNVNDELVAVLTLGQVEATGGPLSAGGAEEADSGGSAAVGYLLLLGMGAGVGALGGLSTRLPGRASSIALNTTAMIVIVGLLQDQINTIITLPDAIWLVLLVSAGYLTAEGWQITGRLRPGALSVNMTAPQGPTDNTQLIRRLLRAAGISAAIGIGMAVLLLAGGASTNTLPGFLPEGSAPILESLILGRDPLGMIVLFTIAAGALGLVGATIGSTSGIAHRIAIMIMLGLLVLGVINAAGEVTLLSAAILAAVIVGGQLLMEQTANEANARFIKFNAGERRTSQTVIGIAGLAFALIIPQLLTGYINNVVDLVGLFTMMGLGLNIVVGYAGLLDLGYVAFFAIGAYSTGLLTTPNVVTCPPPGGNVVVVQQALADEGAFADDFDLLRNEPVGVVGGTRAPYVAVSSLTRPDLVEFDTHEAALAALQSGEVLAIVDQQDVLAPILDTADDLAISAPFAPAIDAWPAREFNAAEQGQWCNVWSFWAAWPMAVLISGLAGVALGIPVLRLRGDYLAIVTLGFGEIIRLVTLADVFKPFLGGAQGIINIQSPVIDLTNLAPALVDSNLPLVTQLGDALSDPISLSRPNEIYYLILAGVLLTAFISFRLSRSRLGRSWRAMREDEDVAQAMGVNLVRSKLLAFSIGAAFSGIGGAIFGSYLKSIFPNSFTLLVSINVLSLIIIGGMGSIPGVFIGALAIFGLPEALREFEEFRLLMFGGLLVLMMLLRPEGLLPPRSPRLEEEAEKALAEEGSVT